MSFKPFDTSKIDEYTAAAKESWGKTPQWEEYERKWAHKTKKDEVAMGERMMELFVPFGRMADESADPGCDEAQAQVSAIQAFITQNLYTCTDEILAQLGKAYGSGGDFTRNINAACGPGTAEFAAAAVEAHCTRACQ